MRRFFLLFAILLTVVSVNAQKVTGGLFIGPNLSWLKPDSKTTEMEKVKLGMNGGVVLNLNLSDNFSFGTGVTYNYYGGKVTYGDSISKFETEDSTYQLNKNTTVDYKIQYIEIPISLIGKTNEIGYITYFLKVGVQPAFRYKAKGGATTSDDNIKQTVAAATFGFHVGGGIHYSLGGNTKLLVEVIYQGGLSDITKTQVYVAGQEKDVKINLANISLKIGILF